MINEKLLLEVAAKYDLEQVQIFLDQGADLSIINRWNQTLLIKKAAIKGHLSILRRLIEPFLKDKNYNVFYSAFALAALNGHLPIIQYLIEAEPSFSQTAMEKKTYSNTYYIVGYTRRILQFWALNTEEPLALAAKEGHLLIVKLFIEKYYNSINANTFLVEITMGAAVANKQWPVLNFLIEKYPALIKTLEWYDFDALDHASALTSPDGNLLQLLLKALGGTEILLSAAKGGNLPLVQFLVEKENPRLIKRRDYLKEKIPVMFAAENGHLPVVQYLFEKDPQSVNVIDKYGYTALFYAAYNGHFPVVRYIVEKGGNNYFKEYKDINGNTVLALAKQNKKDFQKAKLIKKQYPTSDLSAVIHYLEIFKQPLNREILSESYVIIRVWPPTLNKKKAPLAIALAAKPVTDTDVGHVSMAIYKNGKLVIYISHWPHPTGPAFFGKSRGYNNSVASDLGAEKALPYIQVILYSLNIQRMIDHFQKINAKLQWSLSGSALLKQSAETITHSCSSLVNELLEQGNLFKHLLDDKEKLINPVTPLQVGELAQKAQEVENIFYPETKEFAQNYLLTYKAQLMEHAHLGSDGFITFLMTTPDLFWLYAKKFGAVEIRTLLPTLETTLQQANARFLLNLVKEKHEQSSTFKEGNILAISKQKINGSGKKIETLLTDLGYSDRMINSEKQFFLTLIQPYLTAIINNQKADLNYRDENGYNAIHWAVINNSPQLLNLLLTQFGSAINDIIDYKIVKQSTAYESIVKNSKKGILPLTPLDLAYEFKLPNIIKILQEKGGLTQAELIQKINPKEPAYTNLLAQIEARDFLYQQQEKAMVEITKVIKEEKQEISTSTLSEVTINTHHLDNTNDDYGGRLLSLGYSSSDSDD